MTNNIADTSLRKIAKVAGLAYVLIIVDALITLIFVNSSIFVPGNIAATTNNIMANGMLFRIGIALDIIMFVLVVLLSVALYLILKTVNKNFAFFALFLRFGEGILGAVGTVLGGLIPLLLLSEVTVFETEQL